MGYDGRKGALWGKGTPVYQSSYKKDMTHKQLLMQFQQEKVGKDIFAGKTIDSLEKVGIEHFTGKITDFFESLKKVGKENL